MIRQNYARSSQLGIPYQELFDIGSEFLKFGSGGQNLDSQMISLQGETEREIATIVRGVKQLVVSGSANQRTVRQAIQQIEFLRDTFTDFALYQVGTNRAEAGARDITNLATRSIRSLEFELSKVGGFTIPGGDFSAAGVGLGTIALIGLGGFLLLGKKKSRR